MNQCVLFPVVQYLNDFAANDRGFVGNVKCLFSLFVVRGSLVVGRGSWVVGCVAWGDC